MNLAIEEKKITEFIKTEVKQLGKKGVTIGLSGDLGGNSLPNKLLIGLSYEELDPILKMISQGKDLKKYS